MSNKHTAPRIWGPYELLPTNLALFRKCVRGAAEDLKESGKLDYEWMAYYDDHCTNVQDGKELTNQEIDNDRFQWNVMRYYKYLIGRVGPEWTVYLYRSRYRDYEYIPASSGEWVVAFQTTEKTKMTDFKKKVLPFILQHPDVQKVDYVKMRVISQWQNYDLPRLIS